MTEFPPSETPTPYEPPALIAIRSEGQWVFGEVRGGSEEWIRAEQTIPVVQTY